MNQKGEATLFALFGIMAICGFLTLSTLKLQASFKLLQKRTTLFLCAKEAKGETEKFLIFMGRTNWGIRNASRASMLMAFIPGLQGGAMKADKVKKTLIHIQNLSLIPYMKKVKDLKSKNCPIDPRMLLTPFEISTLGFKRDGSGAAKLRSNKWSYILINLPYHLKLGFDATGFESLRPRIKGTSSESAAKLSSLWFSPY